MVKQYSAEFKLEAAKMMVDHHYTVAKAAEEMGVSLTAINAELTKMPRYPPAGLPLTPEQIEYRVMKKRYNVLIWI